jgi:acetyl esterase/lipase
MKKILFFSLLLIATSMQLNAQVETPLYPTTIPNSIAGPNLEKAVVTNGVLRYSRISIPTYTVFQPANPSPIKSAVIIFPGGGYSITSSAKEGSDVAKVFNEWGITAILIKYRMPNDTTMLDKSIGPLQDAQQSIITVRENAEKWGIDPNKIGIIGFSAGGHLASSLGTRFKTSLVPNPNNTSMRPSFMILAYPVISFQDSICHMGSRNYLIGKKPTKEQIDLFSNELHVTAETPPSFLVHASDDGAVKVENSIRFYQALVANKIVAEMHIYQAGGHGFGLNNKTTKDNWMERVRNWLIANQWL